MKGPVCNCLGIDSCHMIHFIHNQGMGAQKNFPPIQDRHKLIYRLLDSENSFPIEAEFYCRLLPAEENHPCLNLTTGKDGGQPLEQLVLFFFPHKAQAMWLIMMLLFPSPLLP